MRLPQPAQLILGPDQSKGWSAMNSRKIVRDLSYLYRIVEAGEKGYAVAAANIDNMGLKILFQSYAQQRARFKSEILAEIMLHGGNTNIRSSIRGAIHRGRIDIFSALAAGKSERERIIVNEVVLGESAAVKAYRRTLKCELPVETRKVIVTQNAELLQTHERVHLLQGMRGKHLVVQLFKSQKEMARALHMLEGAGHSLISVESIRVSSDLEPYEGRSNTVLEASASGAVGGAAWGGMIGAIAATSVESTLYWAAFGKIYFSGVWSLIVFAGILGGVFIGTSIGYAIGVSVKQDNANLYDPDLDKSEQTLLLVLVENSQFPEVRRILSHFNLRSAGLFEEMSA